MPKSNEGDLGSSRKVGGSGHGHLSNEKYFRQIPPDVKVVATGRVPLLEPPQKKEEE